MTEAGNTPPRVGPVMSKTDVGWDIPGRYDAPGIHIEPGINYEAAVTLGTVDAYFNALDLLEVALAVAWSVDPDGVNEVLSRGRTNGFTTPRIGDGND